MKPPKVSIIIPVYNVEQYLTNCLESVIAQTLQHIEIICIDDGSTDSSPQILKQFQAGDDRVKIKTVKNGGQGIARNLGIGMAAGEFIGFVDADDWVDETMFEKLYTSASRTNSEIAMCYLDCYDEAKQKVTGAPYFKLQEKKIAKLGRSTLNFDDIKTLLPALSCTAWNKIYDRSFLKKANIRYDEGRILEDVFFHFKSLLNAGKVSVVPEAMYKYRINRPGSTMVKGGQLNYILNMFNRLEKHIAPALQDSVVLQGYTYFKVRQLIRSLGGVILSSGPTQQTKKDLFQSVSSEFKKTSPVSSLSLSDQIQFTLIRLNLYSLFELNKKLDRLKEKILK